MWNLESYEFLCTLVGLDPDEDETEDLLEEAIYNKYELDIYLLDEFLKDCLQYCECSAGSFISEDVYTGFADKAKGMWLMKVKDKLANP